MTLTKYKLRELIEFCDERNSDETYTLTSVKGISIQKSFIETKADMDGVSLRPYILVKPNYFAYVPTTSRNGEKITIAHNTSTETYIVSSSYIVFAVKRHDLLLADYLFMYFNRPEFDRYSRFNSWGSARETFAWEEMCDIDISLPPIEVQQKYVDIYNAMVANQKAYEKGLDDLKLVCDGFIKDLRRKLPSEKIGKYLYNHDIRNSDNSISNVKGITVYKNFREPTSKVNKEELKNYKIVKPNWIISFDRNMLLDYVESQMLSHANGYMWYANRGAWGDVNNVIICMDMCLIFILKSIMTIFKAHKAIEETNCYKPIINLIRNSLGRIKTICDEKIKILGIPGIVI